MASQRSERLPASWRAYRIADRRHKIFDGQGAATFGGRWNSPGRRVIYAAETFAGAMLEVLVNANIGANAEALRMDRNSDRRRRKR